MSQGSSVFVALLASLAIGACAKGGGGPPDTTDAGKDAPVVDAGRGGAGGGGNPDTAAGTGGAGGGGAGGAPDSGGGADTGPRSDAGDAPVTVDSSDTGGGMDTGSGTDRGGTDGGGGTDMRGNTDGGGNADGPGPDTGPPTSASVPIGPGGGTIDVVGASLTIPVNALAVTTMIEVTRVDDPVGAPYTLRAPIYRLGPVGQTFAAPVRFTWHNQPSTSSATWWTTTTAPKPFSQLIPTFNNGDVTVSNSHFSCVALTDVPAGSGGVPPTVTGICATDP